MIGYHLEIKELQKLADANVRALAALEPRNDSAIAQAIYDTTVHAHRFMVSVTHVDTSSLKLGERAEFDASKLRGQVFIDPYTVNPRSGNRPAEYGIYENARGGPHAFFDKTVAEAQTRLGRHADKLGGHVVNIYAK